jgi:hypothetical protein
MELTTVYSENHTTELNTLCEKCKDFNAEGCIYIDRERQQEREGLISVI